MKPTDLWSVGFIHFARMCTWINQLAVRAARMWGRPRARRFGVGVCGLSQTHPLSRSVECLLTNLLLSLF